MTYCLRLAFAAAWSLAFLGQSAHAACNVIPGTSNTFRGTQGSTDRPFARPGDFVELALDPKCTGTNGFPSTNPADYVVVVIFTPPNGPPTVKALAETCPASGVCGVTCDTANLPGQPRDLDVIVRGGRANLRFRFPDTDDLLGVADDDRTLTGPARIAVTTNDGPSPCAFLAGICDAAPAPGVLACIDRLFEDDGSCDATPNAVFPGFTALPPPNNYQAVCSTPSPPCLGNPNAPIDVRFTVDSAGNVLVPMDWRGVLVRLEQGNPVSDAVPFARSLRGSTSLQARLGIAGPIRVPGNSFLTSYSPQGGKVAPIFDPQADPSAANVVTFFGTADAPETVLRVARRSPVFRECLPGRSNAGLPCSGDGECGGLAGSCGETTCRGGSQSGTRCDDDGDCPGGECGPALFDFDDRLVSGVGPIIASDVTAVARDPVALDGLAQSTELSALVLAERLEGKDLNADGDTEDDVLEMLDRRTGEPQAIGQPGLCKPPEECPPPPPFARAVARILQPPFSFPAFALDGDVLTFLEPEVIQGGDVGNGDRDLSDLLVRVLRIGRKGVTELDLTAAASPAPILNDRAVLISNGQVFFRSPEAAGARRGTTRISPELRGGSADFLRFGSFGPALSADGRYVSYLSDVVDPDRLVLDVYAYDRRTGTRVVVSRAVDGTPSNGDSFATSLSRTGRFVAFDSEATNLIANDQNGDDFDVFVYDRDTDGDGIFDEPGSTRLDVASIASGGVAQANDVALFPALSGDGRYVAFDSTATNLAQTPDANGASDVFVHDRLTLETTRVSEPTDGGEASGGSFGAAISANGRFVAFESTAANLVAGDTNVASDVFVHDRLMLTTDRVSIASAGDEGNDASSSASISADGRYVAFTSFASNLVAGDTNGAADVFVHDRFAKTTSRVSTTAGRQANGSSGTPAISGDGLIVAFRSTASNLAPDDTNGLSDIFVHDRSTGASVRASITSDRRELQALSAGAAISGDGQNVAFASFAGDLSQPAAVLVRGIDTGQASQDITRDGDLDDTVLRAIRLAPRGFRTLCPAGQTAVAGGTAAFLRPESGGIATGCPDGPDLNGDGDADDDVVHLATPEGPVQNLGRAATAVDLSEQLLGVLTSESAQGATDLNGDGDTADTVLETRAVAGGDWQSTGQAADALDITGSIVAFLTPERNQGAASLNDDADTDDRVVQIYDAASHITTNLHRAAEEIVLGGSPGRELVAFRVREASQGADLNDDGDLLDDVLQVYDVHRGCLLQTFQAVVPCPLEACDPRVPYRVLGDTVVFLTLEGQQSEDLNRDGDSTDLVLQIFNARMAAKMQCGSPLMARGRSGLTRTAVVNALVTTGEITSVAASPAGVCTNTGQACARPGAGTDSGCGSGICFVPPGGCLKELQTACDTDPENPVDPNAPPRLCSCDGDPSCDFAFCDPVLGSPGEGTCRARLRALDGTSSSCSANDDCKVLDPVAVCNNDAQSIQRLVGPLTDATGDVATTSGALAFTSAGRCVESLDVPCLPDGCAAGTFCPTTTPIGGATCQREHGVCTTTDECPAGTCRLDLIVSTADDADRDELADPFDNCPQAANAEQSDVDGDGIGDACDEQSCGDGVRGATEQCDTSDDDACPAECQADCSCPGCTPAIAGSRVTVRTRSRGVTARMTIPLDDYTDQPVTVRVEDRDGVIALQNVGALAPRGDGQRSFVFRGRGEGLQRIVLRRTGDPGLYSLRVNARRWLDAARLNRGAGDTRIVVTIGDGCVSTGVTRMRQ
ncbi:MAG TPA: hypothetical protein VGR62_03385 [Candidatus Binatia bacterium]|jgi:Tol biopolymer transport system component|nr:hypothetical protein [Candidatus Binatia bacterium]